MYKEFCNYTQSLALKELGFDEECLGLYRNGSLELKKNTGGYYDNKWINHFNEPKICTAPLYQQAFSFFREKYNHVGFIQLVEPEYGGEYGYVIYYNPNHLSVHHWNKGFKTYEEAESACLDKLIEICKNK